MKRFILALKLVFCFLLSCFGQEQDVADFSNKSIILQSALRLAFSDDRLISPHTLTHIRQMVDSVEVSIDLDSIWVIPYGIKPNELPSGQFGFKITSREEICSLPKSQPIPYILEIEILEYSSDAAKVKIETTCRSSYSNECQFGFMCGHGLGIKLTKVKNTWEPEIEAQWAN